jgi:hypothetical protein
MPLPVIPNVFRCAFNWVHSTGQKAENVMHVQDLAGGHTAHDAFLALDGTIPATVFGNCSSGASVTTITVTPLDGSTASSTFTTTSPHWAGNTGGDMIPAAAQVVKLPTTLRGRSHRGRVFLPFIAETAQANGAADASVTATMTTQWNAWETALVAHSPSWSFVVASYKLATANAVGTILVEGELGTQRRRQSRNR